MLSFIYFSDVFQRIRRGIYSSSSLQVEDWRRTLRVPKTVLVLPVPGGPWMRVIPYCFKLEVIASYCD